jgi:hypothetical protein
MNLTKIASLLMCVFVVAVSPTQAATSASSPTGQSLTVSKSKNISPRGAWLTVTGKKFNETVGIYVALCVIPKKGKVPSPCGGGVDKTGNARASVWISSNPPRYGLGLAVPYAIGGKFSVKLKVGPKVGSFDCRKIKCAITSRADHLQTSDRSADVFIPVTFAK